MTCPFSKLGLSDVLWSAHFNSLLLLHLVLSLPLFWSEHCIQHCWHHPRLAWNATALSRGAPGSCSGAAVVEGQGDENTSAVWSSSCAGLYFRTEWCSEKSSWVGKGKQPFHWAGSVIQNRKIKSHLPVFFSKLSQLRRGFHFFFRPGFLFLIFLFTMQCFTVGPIQSSLKSL